MTEKELKVFSSVLTLAKMSLSAMVKTDDDKIKVSGLYDEWTEGNHAVGEIYTAKNQVWECFQAYDNSTYPDINPENPAWNTFNRPLHGKTKDTAMPWSVPTGAHDMYHTGEYMIYNEKLYLCLSDTAYSPDEYATAWQIQE